MMLRSSVSAILFLSTPSARRATEGLSSSLSLFVYFYPRPPRGGRPSPDGLAPTIWRNFYPRPPRGGRLIPVAEYLATQEISIHALREEGDQRLVPQYTQTTLFLSTPSARRATTNRKEGRRCLSYFYPRPPRGGRRVVLIG